MLIHEVLVVLWLCRTPFLPLAAIPLRHDRFTALVKVLHVKQIVLSHRNGNSNFGGRVEKLDSKQALLPKQFKSQPISFGVMFRSQRELRVHFNP